MYDNKNRKRQERKRKERSRKAKIDRESEKAKVGKELINDTGRQSGGKRNTTN